VITSALHPLSCLARLAAAGLLALGASSAFAVSDCELNGESVSPYNGATTRGKTGLMRCRNRETGQLEREQELRDGDYVGLERFYREGKLLRESNVNARGNREGRHREFGPEGQVLVDAEYVNGENRGLAKRFHPSGQLERVDFHPADKSADRGASASFNAQGQLRELRCGSQPQLAPLVDDAKLCGFSGGPSQVELFDGSGRLVARASWRDGQRVRHATLDEQGRVRSQDETDGTRRVERELAADGTLRRERERVMNGRETVSERLRQFSESGTLVREQRWAGGRPVSDQQFYLNGQPRSKTEWTAAEGGTRVAETDYRDDGKIASTGTWLEQRGRRQPTGAHQVFDAAGRLVAETTYDERGRPSREKAWDAQGVLQRDDAVFEDGSRKAFAR
jgi:antitoxin component YwqK of YwqJK toxin-antitoxin module